MSVRSAFSFRPRHPASGDGRSARETEPLQKLPKPKLLICDDELPARERLRALLDELGLASGIVGEAANADEAVACCRALTPDIVLLDIRMPGRSGIEAAAELARLPAPPAVIFTTAYEEHALDAFDVAAVDYVVKPVRRERLEQAITRALSPQRTPRKPDRERAGIAVTQRGALLHIPLDRIFLLRAEQKYVTILHEDGEALTEESLNSIEASFGERVLRIHRNAVIPRARLVALERDVLGRSSVRIRGIDEPVEASRRHVAAIRELLKR